MKRYTGLLLLGIMSMACSPAGPGNAESPMDGFMLPPGLGLIAGGLGGQGNGDGVGDVARFANAREVALDGAGNLYVAESDNHTIRKMVVATGEVTTLAGSPGTSGCSDGIGPAARFTAPYGMAADGAGNLYVADAKCQTIRKVVVATGAVTTLAGSAGLLGSTDGTGSAARFKTPYGVAADTAGNLYVSDSANRTIRKVVVATGEVTTLAGSPGIDDCTDGIGSARFMSPTGLTFDGAGNLYVTDSGCHTIRKVVVASSSVSTLAGLPISDGVIDGTGSGARFGEISGVALDGAGNLYVTDPRHHTIRKVGVASAAVTTLAGSPGSGGVDGDMGTTDGIGSAARFSYPRGVAADGAGNLYVADSGNQTIRKVVAATGAVTTIAGQPTHAGRSDGIGSAARFTASLGVTTDGTGHLYVADTYTHTIRKVVVATGAVTTPAGSESLYSSTDGIGSAAGFSEPYGVAVDGAGNLYVSDETTIRKVAVFTSAVTTLAGSARARNGMDGIGSAAGFSIARGIALDGMGNLYVADSGSQTIRKVVVATGAVTTIAGKAGISGSTDGIGSAARFSELAGVAVDGAGNLYVADSGNQTIRKVVLATGEVTTLAGSPGIKGSADGTGSAARFNGPRGLAVDGAGNLYVADTENNVVRKIQTSTGVVVTVVGVAGQLGVKPGPLPGRLNRPSAVAALPSGELFILDENSVLSAR